MNGSEGIRRIAKAVCGLGYLLGTLLVGVAFMGAFASDERDWATFWLFVGCGAIVAVIGVVLAWIIEGFATPKK